MRGLTAQGAAERIAAAGFQPPAQHLLNDWLSEGPCKVAEQAIEQLSRGDQNAQRYIEKRVGESLKVIANGQGASSQPSAQRIRTPAPTVTDRLQHKVFGRRYAIQFQAATSKATASHGGQPTVFVEAASAKEGTDPRKVGYDWKNKSILQVGQNELPMLIGCLMGWIPAVSFKRPTDTPKTLDVVFQQDNAAYFVSLSEKGKGKRGVPMGKTDHFQVLSLCLSQLRAANPGLDGTTLLSALKAHIQIFGSAP